jgi:nucleoside-diphosphate-sugar epimerase
MGSIQGFYLYHNVVDPNWKTATHPNVAGEAFSIGCGSRTSLNQLIEKMNGILGTRHDPARTRRRATYGISPNQ